MPHFISLEPPKGKDRSEPFFETENVPTQTLGHLAIAKPKPPKRRKKPRKNFDENSYDTGGGNFTM